jgi:hypothetical protein
VSTEYPSAPVRSVVRISLPGAEKATSTPMLLAKLAVTTILPPFESIPEIE